MGNEVTVKAFSEFKEASSDKSSKPIWLYTKDTAELHLEIAFWGIAELNFDFKECFMRTKENLMKD